jgi:oligopeptide/dipeptide ABC transporter ATP-binding protein
MLEGADRVARMTEPSALLEVEGLAKHFPIARDVLGRPTATVRAVDGVSFSLARGRTLAVVGESGCGKTTLSRMIMRLIEPTAGTIRFAGESVETMSGAALRAMRRRTQIVFQDPFSSLDPRQTVRRALAQPLSLSGVSARKELNARSKALLDMVGLNAGHLDRYPHEFSGGQRQRLCIARALASSPELLVADEPVSALDVSVQAQIINLIKDLQRKTGIALLLVTHDLGVVRQMADEVLVLYLGRVIEYADADSLFSTPRHPYTRALLDAVPSAAHRARERVVATGDVPSPIAPPPGCHFHPRCAFAAPLCKTTAPVLEPVSPTQTVSCHRWREIPLRDAPQAEAAESDTVLARRLRAFDIANRKKTAAALG